jgi:hypothetical protein
MTIEERIAAAVAEEGRAQRVVQDLLKRLNAKNRILVGYQLGVPPKESTFRDLTDTEGAEQRALEWLTQGEPTS